MLVQVHAAHVQDLVAIDHAAALVHGQAAVGIAVIGKAHVQALLHHVALQALHMRGAAVDVNVKAIGRGIDHAHVGAQRVEHRLGHPGRRAAGGAATPAVPPGAAEPLAQSMPILTPCSEKFALAMSEAM